MTHSPYLNHTPVYSTHSHRAFEEPPRDQRSHYMNYRDRLMDSHITEQIAVEEKSDPYVITTLNVISAGLCIAAFGLGVAWFGWPERLTPLFEELGVTKPAQQEPAPLAAQKPAKKPPVSEGYYTAQIEGDTLLIPGAKLRHIHRVERGLAQRIDLLSKTKTIKTQSTPLLPSADKDKIFISLSALATTITPEKRLETTYKHHLADDGAVTSLGLTLYRFKQDTGYGDQELYTGILPDGPYVSVCFDEMAGLNASRCLASVNIGENLVARYNFDRSHIKEWQNINLRVRETVEQMIVR